MVMSRQQNAGQNHNKIKDNKSFHSPNTPSWRSA